MPVQIEEVMMAKSQKSLRVKLGGTWYGASLDSGLNGAKGKFIEAEIQTSEKFGPWINKWVPSGAAPQVAPQAQPSPSPAVAAPTYAGAPTQPGDNITPWYWPSVSNICAACIEKGIITKPEELNQWAIKWAQVCVATKEAVK